MLLSILVGVLSVICPSTTTQSITLGQTRGEIIAGIPNGCKIVGNSESYLSVECGDRKYGYSFQRGYCTATTIHAPEIYYSSHHKDLLDNGFEYSGTEEIPTLMCVGDEVNWGMVMSSVFYKHIGTTKVRADVYKINQSCKEVASEVMLTYAPK